MTAARSGADITDCPFDAGDASCEAQRHSWISGYNAWIVVVFGCRATGSAVLQ